MEYLNFSRVYCKYHYLEGHEFETPEDELLHFLMKMEDPNWEWSEQYEREQEPKENQEQGEMNSEQKYVSHTYICTINDKIILTKKRNP